MAGKTRGARSKSRGKRRGHPRRRATSRPSFLRYRWWFLIRSRRAQSAAIGILVVVLAVAFARRWASGSGSGGPAAPPGESA
jgi:hypothetical protein